MPRVYIRIEEIEPSSGQSATEEVRMDWEEFKALLGDPEMLKMIINKAAARVEARAKELARMAPEPRKECPKCRGLGWEVNQNQNDAPLLCTKCHGDGKI